MTGLSVVPLYLAALRRRIEERISAGSEDGHANSGGADLSQSQGEQNIATDANVTDGDAPAAENAGTLQQQNEGAAEALAVAHAALASIPPTPDVPPLIPFTVVPDHLHWKFVTDGPAAGGWTRLLWANELYQERRSASIYRADDMVTMTKVQCPSTMDRERFIELLRTSLIHVRFYHPMIAATIVSGTVEPASHPAFVYRVPGTFDELEEWRDDTLSVERPRDGSMLDDIVEQLRLGLISNQLDVVKNTRRMHLVLSDHPDEKHTVAFVSHAAHAVTDTYSELTLVRVLLESIAAFDTGTLTSPSDLHWGEETKRLPAVLQELIGYSVLDYDPDKALALAGRVLAGYSLRLDPYKTHGIGRIMTERNQVVFTPEETSAIHSAARAKGFTMTQMVDAARHLAYIEMRRVYLENPRVPKLESIHTNFLMPFDVRKRFSRQWSEQPVVCNTTTGFSTIVPLMDPYFERADAEIARHDVPVGELNQVQVLCRTAENLKGQYNEAYNDFEKLIHAQPLLVHLGGVLEDFYPPSDVSPEGFSSVGVLERTLPREIPLSTHEEPFRPLDWYVSLMMSRHIASLHFSMHMWTQLDQLHISVVHAETYKRDFIMRMLNSMRVSLLLFARAFGHEEQ